jgi:hypothetical protein
MLNNHWYAGISMFIIIGLGVTRTAGEVGVRRAAGLCISVQLYKCRYTIRGYEMRIDCFPVATSFLVKFKVASKLLCTAVQPVVLVVPDLLINHKPVPPCGCCFSCRNKKSQLSAVSAPSLS